MYLASISVLNQPVVHRRYQHRIPEAFPRRKACRSHDPRSTVDTILEFRWTISYYVMSHLDLLITTILLPNQGLTQSIFHDGAGRFQDHN